MIRPEVSRLFKYSAPGARILRSLRTGAFWFANPRSFNDPFDCRIGVAPDSLQESVEHALRRLTSNPGYAPGSIPPERWKADENDSAAFEEFRQLLAGVTDNIGLLCLAEDSTNILMWGHYGGSHKGVCIGFKRDAHSFLGREAMPVEYRPSYPRLSAADFDPVSNPHSFDLLWRTKAEAWSYEREWRLVQTLGDRPYAIDAPISDIVFGANISETDRTSVVDAAIAGGHSPTFRQAMLAQNQFALELVEWRVT
jgi:hypothetical protein